MIEGHEKKILDLLDISIKMFKEELKKGVTGNNLPEFELATNSIINCITYFKNTRLKELKSLR